MYYLIYKLKNVSKFFFPKKYETRWVNPLCASLWFSRMVGWCTWFRENQSSEKNIKICSLSILYWLSVDGAFYFFVIFGDEKKIPEFLDPNYMLLLLIFIEQNIILTKLCVNQKTLVFRISVTNFKSIR